MTTNREATVLVDFEIDRRDLFRASLDYFRWRLLFGLIIVLALIVPLAYLFIMIGEGEMFLKLSPLFIGMPLLALGGQVLRSHAAIRKYVVTLPESQRRLQYMFQSTADGYDKVSGDSFSHTAWKDIMQVVEKPTYFIFAKNAYETGIIPKQGFQPDDIPVFRSIVRLKLGKRAKVSDG